MNAEFWVAVAFVIFVGFLLYMGVHRTILDALDQRSARIKAELDEALRLKEEASNLLAAYRRKHAEAEREAEAIIGTAKIEAERIAADAKSKMEELVARMGSYLDYEWQPDNSATWQDAGPVKADGRFIDDVSGDPSMIQGRFGLQGNFEMVVPVAGGRPTECGASGPLTASAAVPDLLLRGRLFDQTLAV